MAKKYENFSVGDNLSKTSDSYSAWTNDLLRKLVAGKTIIHINKDGVFTFFPANGGGFLLAYCQPLSFLGCTGPMAGLFGT